MNAMTDNPSAESAATFLRLVASKQIRTHHRKVAEAAARLGVTVTGYTVGEPWIGPIFTGQAGTFKPKISDGNPAYARLALLAAGLGQ